MAPAFSATRSAIRSATEWSSSGPMAGRLASRKNRSEPKSHFAVPGLYVYDGHVVEFCRQLAPSARGELEITDLNLAYLERNELHVKTLSRGMAWLDTGTQTSLLEAGNYIATIEHRQGLKIACLEEVAFRMSFIDQSALERIVDELPKGEYREYLRMVCDEGPVAHHPEPATDGGSVAGTAGARTTGISDRWLQVTWAVRAEDGLCRRVTWSRRQGPAHRSNLGSSLAIDQHESRAVDRPAVFLRTIRERELESIARKRNRRARSGEKIPAQRGNPHLSA